MEIDANVPAHDLLWRSMSLRTKKDYREAFGAARDAIVDHEVRRLVEAGYVVKGESGAITLTEAGRALHKQMTTICKKSE